MSTFSNVGSGASFVRARGGNGVWITTAEIPPHASNRCPTTDARAHPESFGTGNLLGFNGKVVVVACESRDMGDITVRFGVFGYIFGVDVEPIFLLSTGTFPLGGFVKNSTFCGWTILSDLVWPNVL